LGELDAPPFLCIIGSTMANTFLISDTHFSHEGVCRFLRADGGKLRPWDTAAEMDEALVERWNSIVRPKDKVYHLGDVAIPRKGLDVLSRLNGDKVLIKGNHDIFKLKDYTEHFRDVRGYGVVDNIIMSHIPVHPDSKGRFRANIHGHLHSNKLDDPWYLNVSVEQIDFTPISFEDAKKRLENQNG